MVVQTCPTVRFLNPLASRNQETLATTLNPVNDKLNEGPLRVNQTNVHQNLELRPLTKIHDESEDVVDANGVRKNRIRFITNKEGDQAAIDGINSINSIQIELLEDEKESRGPLRLADNSEDQKSEDCKEIGAGDRRILEFHEGLKTDRERRADEMDIPTNLSLIAKAEDSYTSMLPNDFI